jgi:hypothetical protein
MDEAVGSRSWQGAAGGCYQCYGLVIMASKPQVSDQLEKSLSLRRLSVVIPPDKISYTYFS